MKAEGKRVSACLGKRPQKEPSPLTPRSGLPASGTVPCCVSDSGVLGSGSPGHGSHPRAQQGPPEQRASTVSRPPRGPQTPSVPGTVTLSVGWEPQFGGAGCTWPSPLFGVFLVETVSQISGFPDSHDLDPCEHHRTVKSWDVPQSGRVQRLALVTGASQERRCVLMPLPRDSGFAVPCGHVVEVASAWLLPGKLLLPTAQLIILNCVCACVCARTRAWRVRFGPCKCSIPQATVKFFTHLFVISVDSERPVYSVDWTPPPFTSMRRRSQIWPAGRHSSWLLCSFVPIGL